MTASCDTEWLLSKLLLFAYMTPMFIVYLTVVYLIVRRSKMTPFYILVLGIAFGDTNAIVAEYMMFADKLVGLDMVAKTIMVFLTTFGQSVGQKIQFIVALVRLVSVWRPMKIKVSR